MDIYLIRHGETDYNKKKRLQGVTDIPLNAQGIALAEKTAAGLRDISFDLHQPFNSGQKNCRDHSGKPGDRDCGN